MSPVHTYLPTTQPDRRLIQSNGSSKVVMSNDINDFPGGYPGHGSSSYGSDRRSGDRYLGDKLLSQSDNETAPHESEPFESAQPPVASYALRHPGPRLEINRSINTGNDLCIEIRSTNVIRKLTIGSRPLKDASVVLRRKIRAHGQRPPVPLLIQMETGEATEALEWAIRIASGDHPGASELQYAQFVELVHIVWEYKFIVELRGIADFIRITHWRSPGETSGNAFVIGTPTTWYEAWMFLASLFGWGDIFQEASREVILDNDCDKFYPAPGRNRLPRILQDDVLRNQQEMKAAIKGFADTLTSGEGLQPSNAVFRATWEIRNGLNKHGIKLASKESHSPAQLLHVLGQLLDGRFLTPLGGPDPPSDAPSHVRRRSSAASNHRQSADGAVGREGQLVTAIEVGILRFGSRVKEKFGTERRRGELEANVCNLSHAELQELDTVYDGFRTAFRELKTQLHGLDLNDYRGLWRNHMKSKV